MKEKESKPTNWKKVYTAVVLTGLFYIIMFLWFTESFNLP